MWSAVCSPSACSYSHWSHTSNWVHLQPLSFNYPPCLLQHPTPRHQPRPRQYHHLRLLRLPMDHRNIYRLLHRARNLLDGCGAAGSPRHAQSGRSDGHPWTGRHCCLLLPGAQPVILPLLRLFANHNWSRYVIAGVAILTIIVLVFYLLLYGNELRFQGLMLKLGTSFLA